MWAAQRALNASQRTIPRLIDVSDTASGIPERGRYFPTFHDNKPNGTGVGLAVVRELLSAHGRRISYTSKNIRGPRSPGPAAYLSKSDS